MGENMREIAYRKLREAIVYGNLKPGERLVEADLCRTFQTGRTPLREALRQLEVERFLDVVPNKGALVKKTSPNEIESMYDVMALFESFAVRKATERMVTTEEREELQRIQNELIDAESRNDWMGWLDKNYEFHLFFPRHSGNEYLRASAEDVRAKIYRYRFAGINSPRELKASRKAHKIIFDSVMKGDGKRGSEVMWKHVQAAKELVMGFFRKDPNF